MKLCTFVPFHINLTFSRKIILGSDGLLQPRPEPAVGPLEFLPGEVDENLLDGGGQGLHLVVSCCGGPVNIPLRNATQKIVLSITIK
jgi:hypothetical protein